MRCEFCFCFFFFSCQKVLSALHWTKHTLEYLLPTLTMPFMDLILQLETKIQVWFLSHIHSWLYVVWVFTCIQEWMHVYRSFSGVCVLWAVSHAISWVMIFLSLLWFTYLYFVNFFQIAICKRGDRNDGFEIQADHNCVRKAIFISQTFGGDGRCIGKGKWDEM